MEVNNFRRTVCALCFTTTVDSDFFFVDTSNPPAFTLRAPGKPVNIGKGPFVIAMVDPDAPTPQNPDNAPVRHFLGGGFTFKDDGVSLTNSTPAVTEYQPPSPPAGSNPHR